MVMLLMTSTAPFVELFATVVFFGMLLPPKGCGSKLWALGVSVTVGKIPVPLSETPCGLPVALSATESVAARAPLALGVNVTLMVQLPPTASGALQLSVSAKSPLLLPVTATELTAIGALPLLLSVTGCAKEAMLTL